MSARFEHMDLARPRRFCDEAAARLGLPAPSIEKDYWVCWTLRALFGPPEAGANLTFKGGTSLAKGWKLIERFSEDVDIVIDRAALGFAGEAEPAAPSISNRERERRLERLKAAAAVYTGDVLLPGLERAVAREIADHARWTVALDPSDSDGQTILLQYPCELGSEYVRNAVKVELGARSDTEPTEVVLVRSHLSAALLEQVHEAETRVRAVRPERTLWEKIMLLHEESHRREEVTLKVRMSRHMYDIVKLADHGYLDLALRDEGLFERIAAHRRVYFARNRDAHASLQRGALRLVPSDDRLRAWREDYRRMTESMFWSEPPSFDDLKRSLESIEARINALG